MARSLVDTNVLVYASTSSDPRKESIARQRLAKLAADGEVAFIDSGSAGVLQRHDPQA